MREARFGILLWVLAAAALSTCATNDSPCGLSACQGCCDLEGMCHGGDSAKACGNSGSACVSCSARDTCRDGACVPVESAQRCDASNCAGCCDGTSCIELSEQSIEQCGQLGAACAPCTAKETCRTTCLGCCRGEECITPSDTAFNCGAPGASCESCSPVQSCLSARCRAPSCNGCIGAQGICVGGDSDGACGAQGFTCVNCPEGQRCSNGECRSTTEACSPANCPDGCCFSSGGSSRCVLGTLSSQCGSGGQACASCDATAEEQCVDQGCSKLASTDVGSPCTINDECAFPISPTVAVCAEERNSDGTPAGWPGGYCSANCTGQSEVCGSSAACFKFGLDSQGSPQAFCLKRCVGPGQGQVSCRTDYVCRSFNELDGGTGGYCYPSCKAPGAGCASGSSCNSEGYCCPADGGSCTK